MRFNIFNIAYRFSIILFGGGILLGLVSCESILKEDPVSLAVAENYYSTEAGIRDGIKAAYPPLRWIYASRGGSYLTVVGTDIYTNAFGAQKNEPSYNNYDQNLLGTQWFINLIWNNFYKGINQCNSIVERAPTVGDMNETEKSIIIGEARFLRALYYFHLVQQFGDVHFTLEETMGVETEANRTPVNTIYQEGIIPDLEYAIDNLPESTSDYGRATKPAAEAIMARVQLTMGNWSEAERLANNVINNYDFSLVSSIAELWDYRNVVNDEIVFATQYTYDPLNNGEGNYLHKLFNCLCYQNPAVSQSFTYGSSWQRFMPTNYFLELWDTESDLRWQQGFLSHWIADTKATINGFTVNPGDTAMKMVLHPVSDEMKQSVPYWLLDYRGESVSSQTDNFQIGGANRTLYPPLWKFHDPLRASITASDGGRDFPVVRLAEMYLIAAEGALMQNNKSEAVGYIQVIRNRATAPGKEAEMLVTEDMMDLDFILEERARELCGEGHRWYDLKRTGLLLERVRLYNEDAAPNIKEMHLVRPIPQTQIDRVSNPDEFKQNPGY